MRRLKLKVLTLLVVACFSVAKGQLHEGPTIQLGLNGLNFDKGNFDAELVAEIIAEKQSELQSKLIKSMILNNVGTDNGLVYSYLNNSLNIILNSKDQEVVTKQLLENSANMALSVVFAKHFWDLDKDVSTKTAFEDFFSHNNVKFDDYYTSESNGWSKVYKSIGSNSTRHVENDGESLNEIRNRISIYLDLVAMVISENEDLRRYGVFKANGDIITYNFNAFGKLRIKKEVVIADEFTLYQKAMKLKKVLKEELKEYTSIIKELEVFVGYGNNVKEVKETIKNNAELGKAVTLDNIRVTYINLIKNTDKNTLDEHQKDLFANLSTYINGLDDVTSNYFSKYSMYRNKIKPIIDKLTLQVPELVNLNSELSSLLCNIINDKISSVDTSIDVESMLVKMIESVDEFDNIETIDLYLNGLFEIMHIDIGHDKLRAISKVLKFMNSSISIHKDDEDELSVVFEVDNFLMAFNDLTYNKFKPLEFHFTLGANYLSLTSKLNLGNEQVSSLSFMSEKIGLKLKLWDWEYTHSFEPGEKYDYYGLTFIRNYAPRVPTISNIHILAYGSGILYNLVNTGTAEGFNNPLVGAGIGITFFNNLDLNFTYGTFVLQDEKIFSADVPKFYSVGLDIQFTEYLERLGAKRKESQNQKLLSDYNEEKIIANYKEKQPNSETTKFLLMQEVN